MLLALWVFSLSLGCTTSDTPEPTVGQGELPSVEPTPSLRSTQREELPSVSPSATTTAIPHQAPTLASNPSVTSIATAERTTSPSPAPGTPTPATSFSPTTEVSVPSPEVLSSSAAAGFERVAGEPKEQFVLRVDCNVRNNGGDGFVTVVATLFGKEAARETETVFIPEGAELTVSLVFDDPGLLTGLLRFECEARA